MLGLVIDKLLSRRDELLRKIEELEKSDLKDPITWNKIPDPIDLPLVGIDGSMNLKEYKSFAVYAVDAEAIISTSNGIRSVCSTADVDIVVPYWLPRERVRLYMSTLEVKCALKAARCTDALIVMDGSIISMLVKPIPFADVLLRDDYLVRIARSYAAFFEKYAAEDDLELKSKEEVPRIAGKYPYNLESLSLLIEYVEYLTTLKELILSYRERLCSVAKKSHSREIFNAASPDAAIIEKITRRAGFFRRKDLKLLREVKWRVPVYGDVFSSITFTIVYVRLEDRGPVLKIEIPREAGEDEILELLGVFKHHSINGYPYPLTKAHKNVEITNSDMETLIRALGLYWARTGREALY